MPDPIVDGDKSAWANGERSVDLSKIKMMDSSRYHPLKEEQGGKHFHFGSFFVYKKGKVGEAWVPTSLHSVLQLLWKATREPRPLLPTDNWWGDGTGATRRPQSWLWAPSGMLLGRRTWVARHQRNLSDHQTDFLQPSILPNLFSSYRTPESPQLHRWDSRPSYFSSFIPSQPLPCNLDLSLCFNTRGCSIEIISPPLVFPGSSMCLPSGRLPTAG